MPTVPPTNPNLPKDRPDERTEKLGKISRAILVLTGLLWAVWDIVPAVNDGRGDTLSENLRDWSRTAWILPAFFGALMGHFFINIGQPENFKVRFYAFMGVFVGLICANVCTWFAFHFEMPAWGRGVSFFVGMILGVALWPQNA